MAAIIGDARVAGGAGRGSGDVGDVQLHQALGVASSAMSMKEM